MQTPLQLLQVQTPAHPFTLTFPSNQVMAAHRATSDWDLELFNSWLQEPVQNAPVFTQQDIEPFITLRSKINPHGTYLVKIYTIVFCPKYGMAIRLAYSDFVKDLLDQSIKRQVSMIGFTVPFADLVPVNFTTIIASTMWTEIKEVVTKKKYIHVTCKICPSLHDDSQLT